MKTSKMYEIAGSVQLVIALIFTLSGNIEGTAYIASMIFFTISYINEVKEKLDEINRKSM